MDGNVKTEGRVGAIGHDHGRSGIDGHLDRETQQSVDAFADDDVVCLHAMVAGDGVAQIVALGIRVHPRRGCGLLHGADGFGAWAKQALVGAEAGDKRTSARPLLRLGADERHRQRNVANDLG